MLETVIALLCGLMAAAFGMWAFLKGQSSMLDIRAGGRPQLFDLQNMHPRQGDGPDLSKQLREMLSQPRKKGAE